MSDSHVNPVKRESKLDKRQGELIMEEETPKIVDDWRARVKADMAFLNRQLDEVEKPGKPRKARAATRDVEEQFETILARSGFGFLSYVNGALYNDATENDPVEFRGSKRSGDIQQGSTAIVFFGVDIRRASDGKRECLGYICGRMDERFPAGVDGTKAAGEFEAFCRKPNMGSVDEAMVPVWRFRYDGFEYFDLASDQYVRIGSAPPAPGTRTLSPGTKFTAVITEAGEGGPGPIEPPPPPPPPEEIVEVRFVWKMKEYFSTPGDYAGLDKVFGWTVEQSDRDLYPERFDWLWIISRYVRKGEGDDISRVTVLRKVRFGL